jgi:zinc protease
MKRVLIVLFAVLIVSPIMAQVDRSIRPTAKDAPKIEFGDYDLIELDNGLKIIVVEDHKLPRVTMSLIVNRDPILEGEKAGYVEIAGQMLRQGTTTRPKAQLDEEIDFMGASINTSSASASASGLSKYTDKLMELLADVARNPAFPTQEFDKLKQQQKSGLESSKDDPAAVNARVFGALLYGKDHPYGEMATLETADSYSLEDCKTYYRNNWIPNNTYLAIVGDVKKRKIKKMAKEYFGSWAMGNVPQKTYPAPAEPTGVQIGVVNNNSAVQSVIEIGNTINLKPGDPDVVALRLANQILGGGSLGRLFQNIREDKGYTYGAYSDYDSDKLIGSFTAEASVRNNVTDSAIVEFMKEFERLRTEPVPAEELEAAKNFIIGSFGRSLERPSTLASFALNKEIYNLPEDYYETYLERLGSLTAEDVMNAAKKYMKTDAMQISVNGKATMIGDKLEALGKVTYYDKDANVTTKPSMDIPAGVTAETVLDAYTKAIGGAEAVAKVKDIMYVMNAEITGAPIKPVATIKVKKDRFLMDMTAEGMGTLQRMVYDGKTAKMSGMMGNQELEGDDLEEMKMEAVLFAETRYASLGYTTKLTEMVMGESGNALYALKVTSPTGKVVTQYFDAENGLLVKEEEITETPQGDMTSSTMYSDYKSVGGVMLPYARTQMAGPQKITMTATEVKVNSGIKDSEFK